MQIAKHWWKILGVLIFTYVLIAGMIVPLKPGILTVTPDYTQSGSLFTTEINTYNGSYAQATENKAWLKIDSAHYIVYKKIAVVDNNLLRVDFEIPAALPGDDTLVSATVILDNEIDGYSLLPGKVLIKETDHSAVAEWKTTELSGIHDLKEFRFPFRNILYETIRNTFFHVALWMAMFFLMTVALVYSIRYLIKPNALLDHKAASFTSVSLLYGILGLVTGSIWAKYTWGTFWTSDVKLNMAAVAVLIYMAYSILRGSFNDQDKKARIAAAYNIFAYCTMIPLLLIIPRMTDSLHPGNGGNPALGGEDLDNTLRMVFYPSILALILLGIWMSNLRYRILELRDQWINR